MSSPLSDVVYRLIRVLLNLIAWVIGAIFYPSKQRYLPPIRSTLLLESATSLANKIKSGKLKSEDLVQIYIERCKEVHPELNAMVDDNYEEALVEARKVDERVQRELRGDAPLEPGQRSIKDYPFLGVPFTAKNSVAAKGKTFSGGVYARKHILGEKDSLAVERMKRDGGAIFLGLTNIPELVMWIDAFNRIDGQTNNPFDKSRIPGGSSGGEGALIGAAGSVIGIGTDIGGSIRIPSNFNGIFGHKTTPAASPFDGVYPPVADRRAKMASLGPMCRYACDVRPMLKVLVGDGTLNLNDKPLNYSTLKVYYMECIDDPLVTPVDYEIKQGLKRVVQFFTAKGVSTKELDTVNRFSDFRHALQIWNANMDDEKDKFFFDRLTEHKRDSINPFIELIKCMFACNRKYTAAILMAGIMEEYVGCPKKEFFEKMRLRLQKDLHELLGNNAVLICPTFPEIAFKHNQSILKFNSAIYTGLWNAMNVAITTVPMGLDRHGMPFGMQVIGSPNNDNLTIQTAEELEKQFGGWIAPCSVQIQE